jgi:hypothetical protein
MDESEIEQAEANFEREAEAEFGEPEAESRRSGRSPFEKSLTQKVLTKTFYGVFKLAAMVSRSSADFEEREFEEVAADMRELINRFKLARIFFNVLHPVVSCVSLVKKVQKLREGLPSESKEKQSAATNGTGAQGEEILGSMFGPRPN